MAICLLLFNGTFALAEEGDVPMLPDGKVDVDAVMSSFSVSFPFFETGVASEASGSMLGKPYVAAFDATDFTAPFDLTIQSNGLSENATFLVAVLLNDIICMKNEMRPKLLWQGSIVAVNDGWKTLASCMPQH